MVTDLLGWTIDPEKDATGSSMTLLGLKVGMHGDISTWELCERKAQEWIADFGNILDNNYMTPAVASEICGRLAFLNSRVFNRLGRALLRPIIWRQRQTAGPYALTKRLTWALRTYSLQNLMSASLWD